MSTKRLEHLKEGEKIYLEVTKQYPLSESVRFDGHDSYIYVTDNDTFYTLEELKSANDGMPKQGEMIEVRYDEGDYEGEWDKRIFVSFYKGKVIVDDGDGDLEYWGTWRYPPQKTELTLAEVESKLGMEKGSLIIK